MADSTFNFREIKGNSRNNRLRGGDREILYGLAGNDTLISKTGSSIEGLETTILAGGTGNDTHKLGRRATTLILENGRSRRDTVVARGIGLDANSSFAVEVDNRHLYAGDERSGQYVFLLDWRKPKNRIERIRLADGTLTYRQLVKNLGNLDNFSWQELENSGEIDLAQFGLSPRAMNRAIRHLDKRARQLERSPSSTAQDTSRETVDALTGLSESGKVMPRDSFSVSSSSRSHYAFGVTCKNDSLIANEDNNFIHGGKGNDRLLGLGGNDCLVGGRGRDKLFGGDGNDRLNGRKGNDLYVGGAGADIFVLRHDFGTDKIRGFELGLDKIHLAGRLDSTGLDISGRGNRTFLEFNDERIATIIGVRADALNSSSFI